MSGILIIGAGGHGKVVAEIAELSGKWNNIAFLDDKPLDRLEQYPVMGTISDYLNFKDKYESAFVAIGNNTVRLDIQNKLKQAGFIIPVLIHPNSIVSKYSSLGFGTVVMAGAVINPYSHIGNGCIINTCCSIDHDCVLDDGVHISPGAHLAGTVHINRCSWICTGANIINNKSVGCNTIVAAGATVTTDIPDNVMVAGTPAQIKKRRVNE